MKRRAMNLAHRVPSRRGSMVGSTKTQPIQSVSNRTEQHPVANPAVDTGLSHPTVINAHSVAPTSSSNYLRRNDTNGLELPTVSTQRTLTHVANSSTPVVDTLDASLYHDFLRKRVPPPRHPAVTEEIDRELPITEDKDPKELSLADALVKKPNTIDDEKEDHWGRLGELTTFDMVGFGFPDRKIGTGTYNRDRKADVLRQPATDRDALWGAGIRVPIGDRFSRASASLTWGCLQESNVPGNALLLSDFLHRPKDSYGSFAPTGKKMEPRNKKPDAIDLSLRYA